MGPGPNHTAADDETIVELDFAPAALGRDTLVVDVEGFEGPLDLLLALARSQKVDLAKISILALAEQYLSFVREARHLRIELAADYLVMAAWLAYLKSRLLLPQDEEDEGPSGHELAARLAFRLQRLQAMRNVGAQLVARNLLGRDVFARGDPQPVRIEKKPQYQATLYDLLSAYSARREINTGREVRFRPLPVWSVKDARDRLERMIGGLGDWSALDVLLADYPVPADLTRSVTASTFTAALELVREGEIEIRQAQHYDHLFIRRRQEPRPGETTMGRGPR